MRYAVLPIAVLLAGCEPADQAIDRGYDDGYAAGYNTTCEIRSTLIAGDWDNSDYSSGYRDGYAAGASACLSERKAD